MREIVLYGDPILRKKTEVVTEFDDDLRDLVEDMFRIMYEEEGLGLAAPQAGDGRRVFVLDVPAASDAEDDLKLVMVNPRIETAGKVVSEEEGCLSIPGIREKVSRPERVTVVFQDLEGEEYELEADGLVSRAVQHEYDHLEGILFTDRLPSLRRSLLKRKLADIAEGKVPPESQR